MPCFYVRRHYRSRGISGRLVDAAVEHVRLAWAPALEAYPVDTDQPGHTQSLFTGVATTFARRGFRVEAARKADRPIMRLYL